MEDGRARRWAWAAAILAVAVGLVLRARGIERFWPNADECLHWSIATETPEAAARDMRANAHPPLYFEALRGLALIDDEPATFRAVSVALGTLTILVFFLLGREVGGPWGGVAAAWFLAISPGAILQSQVIRQYALQGLLLALGLWGLITWLRRGGTRWLLLYSIAMALAVATQYGSFVVLGGILAFLGVLLLVRGLPPRRLLSLAAAHVPVAAVAAWLYATHLAPVLLGGAMQRRAQETWLHPYVSRDLAGILDNVVGVFEYLFGRDESSVVLGLALAGAVMAWRRRVRTAWLLPLATAAVAIGFAASGVYPMGFTRHSLPLLVVLVLPLAFLTERLFAEPRPWARRLGILLVALTAFRAGRALVAGNGLLTRGLLKEQFIEAEEMADLGAVLSVPAESPETWVMDQQSWHLLAPLMERPRPPHEGLGALSGFHLLWRGRLLLASGVFTLRGSAGAERSEEHFGTFLERLRAEIPQAFAEGTDVWLLSGGWGWDLAAALGADAPGGNTGPALFDRRVGGAHVSAFRVHVDAYLRYLAAHPPPGPQESGAGR